MIVLGNDAECDCEHIKDYRFGRTPNPPTLPYPFPLPLFPVPLFPFCPFPVLILPLPGRWSWQDSRVPFLKLVAELSEHRWILFPEVGLLALVN